MDNLIFIMLLDGKNFFTDKIRGLFTVLDSVAFWLFSKTMGLMFDIASLTANKGAELTAFLEPLQARIYVILSIYMVFKVTISLLTYIVNPDAMTDKSQGVGKLVQRIIVSLVMLIFFPTAFKTANEFQAHIIENNTIPRIVLGMSGNVNSAEGIGTEIAYEVYNGTFMYDSEGGGKISTSPETVEALTDIINEPKDGDPSAYKYSYIPFVGFAVGILLAVLTLSMCIDVAMRVFKLIILQMVAPIPIISYMDPKQAKDGAFSKWIKLTISVWSEVFIRLFVIYFILLVIESLISNGGALVSGTNIFVKIALIIGLLFFAKDAPKFICNAIGIKDVPSGGLFGGLGSIMAAGALGAGAISGFASGFSASRLAETANKKPHNLVKNVGAGLFGTGSGIVAGVGAANKAKDHQARAVMEAMSKKNDATIAAGAAGSTSWGRTKSLASRLITGQTIAMRTDRDIAEMEAQKNALSNVKSRVSGEMVKKDWTSGDLGLASTYGDGNIKANYKSFMAAKDAAAASGLDYVEFKDSQGRDQMISMEEANMQSGFLLKNNEDDYLQQVIADNSKDATLASLVDIANTAAGPKGTKVSNRASVTDTIDKLGIEITRAKSRNETNKQNDRFAGKK